MPHIKHLSKDKILKQAIEKTGRLELSTRKNIFLSLCNSIMSQQLSTKVADIIQARFVNLFDDKKPIPEKVLQLSHETLRSIGLSNAKVTYVQNVARFALEKGMNASKLNKMSNEEVIDYLTEIKGVGRWTVEMLLMFTLGREDVFAVDDLGIQQAIVSLYNIENTEPKKIKIKMQLLAENWAPYRTYACMYLWRWKDGVK
ncbi:MAG TPA: DNA-3-methyladenine glycosylase [Bacteroidia bacterium]|nr:DNA-3-methyladenine glycosylase [Bacteroidia bacterium]